ncbi:MAG: ferrous iron transport protein B [Zetaproteobacteria bacterium CG_4_9_14_3_um_filter_54_145]|nr:MAG: ferrous iron transport protein B [Zetaproteobacteria bacterium CG_4_10_14_3_um_filter_54_28]PJA29086.1 MAG: ferrous iron transport protein B [Zetaproteobacteria bacterium CG_4_9_14_3_um_filter_54_145]
MPQTTEQPQPVLFHRHIYRGDAGLRVALVGQHNSGKSTLFHAVASTSYQTGTLTGTHKQWAECPVQIGVNEVHLVDLPGMHSLRNLTGADLEALKYLLWGDQRPLISRHECDNPPAPFSRPDVLVHVIDASVLGRSLELTLELAELGLPVVVALNMMDEAHRKGIIIDIDALSARLGVAVIPTVALKGHGLAELFDRVIDAAGHSASPLPQQLPPALQPWLERMQQVLRRPIDNSDIHAAFSLPATLLYMHMLERDPYFMAEMTDHFPCLLPDIELLHQQAASVLPRPLAIEMEADRHQRAVSLFESVARVVHKPAPGWDERLDMFFLHPHWGLIGSLAVFAMVLFMVFEVSKVLDAVSAAPLADMIAGWQPDTVAGVLGRAVSDGLIGLIGIVIPYMLPLVLMLAALEESGIMHRIAFVVDRFFHTIGLHGKVAMPFLLGLGCNVPAIAATKGLTSGRDRVVASLLITFVPCSARSAVVLALGAKYLGAAGVFALFLLSMLVIAILGRLLSRRYPELSPGIIQEIPPYAWPQWSSVISATWQRTSDILTIVTPLLVGGSIVLALMQVAGFDQWINLILLPVTGWMLGLPAVLGVPILFGVLRKELSLVMIYQALGTFEIGQILDSVQIATFLVFLLFYIPCISTFAVMLKVIGRKEALFSIILSIGVALITAVAVRFLLTTFTALQ